MDLQSESRFSMFAGAFFVLIGCHWLYTALAHAQTYGLESVLAITVVVMIPVAAGIGVVVIRFLNSRRVKGMLLNRRQTARGPYYIHYWILLLGVGALISMIVFHIERFGSLEAWEAWSLNPHQRTLASVATTILAAATGVAWIIVPGCELVWWVWRGRQTIPPLC